MEKKKKFWIDETVEKFWVKPKSIIDYLAIVWDKADNIPWIDGFWPKKAVDLINTIWTVEEIYKLLEENNQKIISHQLSQLGIDVNEKNMNIHLQLTKMSKHTKWISSKTHQISHESKNR